MFDLFRGAGRVDTRYQAHFTELSALRAVAAHSLTDPSPEVPLDAWGWIIIGAFTSAGTTTNIEWHLVFQIRNISFKLGGEEQRLYLSKTGRKTFLRLKFNLFCLVFSHVNHFFSFTSTNWFCKLGGTLIDRKCFVNMTNVASEGLNWIPLKYIQSQYSGKMYLFKIELGNMNAVNSLVINTVNIKNEQC